MPLWSVEWGRFDATLWHARGCRARPSVCATLSICTSARLQISSDLIEQQQIQKKTPVLPSQSQTFGKGRSKSPPRLLPSHTIEQSRCARAAHLDTVRPTPTQLNPVVLAHPQKSNKGNRSDRQYTHQHHASLPAPRFGPLRGAGGRPRRPDPAPAEGGFVYRSGSKQNARAPKGGLGVSAEAVGSN